MRTGALTTVGERDAEFMGVNFRCKSTNGAYYEAKNPVCRRDGRHAFNQLC